MSHSIACFRTSEIELQTFNKALWHTSLLRRYVCQVATTLQPHAENSVTCSQQTSARERVPYTNIHALPSLLSIPRQLAWPLLPPPNDSPLVTDSASPHTASPTMDLVYIVSTSVRATQSYFHQRWQTRSIEMRVVTPHVRRHSAGCIRAIVICRHFSWTAWKLEKLRVSQQKSRIG